MCKYSPQTREGGNTYDAHHICPIRIQQIIHFLKYEVNKKVVFYADKKWTKKWSKTSFSG